MKTKAPLVLMEQLVMVLVFAFTAVICLRMFVLSDDLSRQYAATDRAVLEAQTVAEHMKHSPLNQYLEEQGASCTDGVWQLTYDAAWNTVSPSAPAAYYLTVTYESPAAPYLWNAVLSISTAEGEELFAIPVSGQFHREVTADA